MNKKILLFIVLMLRLFQAVGANTEYDVIGADFRSMKYRDTDRGKDGSVNDWDVGYLKVICSNQEALTGLSVERHDHQGNAVLCTSIKSLGFSGERSITAPVVFNGTDNRVFSRKGDWDPFHVKLECGKNQYVVGLSQAPASKGRKFHGILCAEGPFSEDALSNVTKVYTFPNTDDRGSQKGGDWNVTYHKGQCADGAYMVGVSLSQNDQAPHSILCSTSDPFRSRLNIFYKTVLKNGETKNLNKYFSWSDEKPHLIKKDIIESNGNPSIAAFDGKLYMAYTSNKNLCLDSSTDNGKTFSQNFCMWQPAISVNPSIAAFNGKLYLAYFVNPVKRSARSLCIASLVPGGKASSVTDSLSSTCFSDNPPSNKPAIAALNGKLYVGYKGPLDNNLYLRSSSDGTQFSGPVKQRDTIQMVDTPSMISFEGKLIVAYKGKGENDGLRIASLENDVFSEPTSIDDLKIYDSPGLAVFDKKLHVAYRSKNDSKLCFSSSNNLSQFSVPQCIADVELADTPSLAVQSFSDTLTNVRFAVYGDMPYAAPAPKYAALPVDALVGWDDGRLLADVLFPLLSSSSNIPFIIHAGDAGRPGGVSISGSATKSYNSCDNTFRAETVATWQKLGKPLFFTPGDNDWTDCNTERLPSSNFDPLRQLTEVREKFVGASRNSNQKNMKDFAQQDGYPENQSWIADDVLYATVHIVSSKNGFVANDVKDAKNRNLEAQTRTTATITWIQEAKKKVMLPEAKLSALVIAFHVDPFGERFQCFNSGDLYYSICAELETTASEIMKPVLLVHGDTNAHCMRRINRPNKPNLKLWVLNAPGDFKSLDVDIVSFNSGAASPFSAVGLLSGRSPSEICDYRD